jgi:hypothetical protein
LDGADGSVGKVIRYGLDSPGIETSTDEVKKKE